MICIRRFFLWFALLCMAFLFFFLFFFSISRQRLILADHKQQIIFRVTPGHSAQSMINLLEKKVDIHHSSMLWWWLRLSGLSRQLHYGEYLITSGMRFNVLFEKMRRGDVIIHSFRIAEGARFSDVIALMKQDHDLTHEYQSIPTLMKRLHSPYSSPEGLFFPDTYQYIWPQSDIDILVQAYKKMQSIITLQWENRSANLYYQNAYQALIMASILEKEASLPEEREQISGVLMRRLKKGMRLQVDPTVAYGAGLKDASKLTRSNLRSLSAYNTYKIKGLPPTPIACPSLNSIKASFHPSEGTAVYYVSKGDGSHQFSDTYQEHLDAVNRFIRSKNKLGANKHE